MEFLQDNLRVFIVPVDIMDVPNLTIYEQMVYMILRSFTNPREATAFPSYNTIAKLSRMSRRKAIDCVNSLVEKELLTKEIRLNLTKNRKVRNTSNLYTIETPLVHSMHQGGAQHAPGVVHSMHQGGAQHAPEHNHLTKTNRTKLMNNNNNNTKSQNKQCNTQSVVVVSPNHDKIKSLLKKHSVVVNDATLTKWRQCADEETILEAIKYTLNKKEIKNVIGYITRLLEEGFTPIQTSQKEGQINKVDPIQQIIDNYSKKNLPSYIIQQDIVEKIMKVFSMSWEEATEEYQKRIGV